VYYHRATACGPARLLSIQLLSIVFMFSWLKRNLFSPAACTSKLFTTSNNIAVQKASGFIAVSHFHLCLIFASNTSNIPLQWNYTMVGSAVACKYKTRVEVSKNDEPASLPHSSIIYSRKKFSSACLRCKVCGEASQKIAKNIFHCGKKTRPEAGVINNLQS
jgi:hypothetical protein